MGPRFCKRGNVRLAAAGEEDHELASMGPRFCKRGNKCMIRRLKKDVLLQWGHAFVSVETYEVF